MASIKIILRNKPNKEGTYPLALQVIKDRRSSIIHVGHSIKLSDWDSTNQKIKKSHPNSVRLNNLLLKKRAEANNTLLELETNDKDTSSKVIKSQIKPTGGKSFFIQANIFVENLKKNGKYNRHKTDLGRVAIFKKFLNGNDITFHEITVNLLNQFKAHLKSSRGVKERTVANYLILIRTIYNQAVNSGITDKKNYPFGKDKVPIKLPSSIKIGLTAEDVKILEDLDLRGYEDHARNVWLVSFYFAGMRLSDVMRMRWTDFQNDRLYYAMAKNQKVDSLKIPEKALAILQKYKDDEPKHDFVFPELKVLDVLNEYEVQRKIAYAGKRLEKALKVIVKETGISKNISMHISRHTFAQIAGDKISIQLLQRLYRHSNITTTIGYQSQFVNKDTDSALDSVLAM